MSSTIESRIAAHDDGPVLAQRVQDGVRVTFLYYREHHDYSPPGGNDQDPRIWLRESTLRGETSAED